MKSGCGWLVVAMVLLGSLFYPDAQQAAAKDRNGTLGDEIVVVLKKGSSISRFNSRHNTAIVESLGDSRRFRLRLPSGARAKDEILAALKDAAVEYAQPNFEMGSPEIRQGSQAFIDPGNQPFQLGVSPGNFFAQPAAALLRMSQAQSVAKGTGVTVAVIDTGVDQSHPLFAGRLSPLTYDFVDDDPNPAEEPGSGFGHGTFVAGLIALTAPNATIMPLRAFDGDGIGTSFSIAKAIRFAADNGARVINMSFGTMNEDPLIKDVIKEVGDKVMMIAAAGNDNQNTVQFPAEESSAISVTATTIDDLKASFANFESSVAVSAPGVDLYSAYPGGLWARWNGTSFSTALVSGETALLVSLNAGLRRSDVMNLVRDAGVDIDKLNPKFDGRLGKVRVDYLDAVNRVRPD